jgi:hypothetical protein
MSSKGEYTNTSNQIDFVCLHQQIRRGSPRMVVFSLVCIHAVLALHLHRKLHICMYAAYASVGESTFAPD